MACYTCCTVSFIQPPNPSPTTWQSRSLFPLKIPPYLEDHPRTDGYVVNNHGDRFRPLSRVVGPLPNGRTLWLINGGDPNYLLSGMILQVCPFFTKKNIVGRWWYKFRVLSQGYSPFPFENTSRSSPWRW